MNCMFGGIRAYNKHTVCGAAFTVKVPAGDNLVAQVALDYAQPGDILVGDSDGLVVIPQADAAELLDAVRANLAMEQDEMKRMKEGTYAEEHHKEIFTEAFLRRGGSFQKR